MESSREKLGSPKEGDVCSGCGLNRIHTGKNNDECVFCAEQEHSQDIVSIF